MPELIGGVAIEKYNFTKAFGVGPASASGVAVGGDPGLSVGDYVVFSFGAIAFHGVVSQLRTPLSTSEGLKHHFSLVDNRIRLAWQTIAGMWNMEEPVHGDSNRVRPDSLISHYSNTTGLNSGDDLDTSSGVQGSGSVDGVSLTDSGSKPEGRRRYSHILPQHHGAQLKTYTDEPLTCAEILSSAFKGAWGGYSFSRAYHPSQGDTALLNVDANNGQQLASFLSKMNADMGLVMTIDGANNLRWERKGDGVFIPPADVQCLDDQGTAISHAPTKVEIIGDRNTVQVLNVPLEPDWESGWEPFLSEVAWVDEVDATFGPYGTAKSSAAERAAKAREVTLAEYIAEKGDGTDLADIRCWGDIGRMDLPVWIYLNEILYRSYRIKPDYKLYGVPMDSLELMDGLLSSCELSGSGPTAKIRYRRDPVELYPAAKAYVAGKGQPLDMLDHRSYEIFSTERTTNLRQEFSPINEFDVDKLHKSFHFNTPIFIDGEPEAGTSIFLYPNKGQGDYEDVSQDLDANSDFVAIVVPNPDYEIMPSDILVSVAWGVSKFKRRYGTGVRRTVIQAPEICEHVLDMETDAGFSAGGALSPPVNPLEVPDPPSPGSLRTLLYEDGSTPDERAEEMASSLIMRNAVETSGSYRRYGYAGTVLGPMHDNISVNIDFQGGIVETVSFEKSRGSRHYEPERVLEGRLVNADLYPGQQELKKEVRQLRLLAKYANKAKPADRTKLKTNFPDVFTRPVGDHMASTTMVDKTDEVPESADMELAGAPWKAGHVVWLNAKGGIDSEGKRLGGIVTMGDSGGSPRKQLSLAKSGIVPTLVQGPFKGGDSIGCDSGENICTVGGKRPVGKIDHTGDYTEDKVMVVNCRMGEAEPERCGFKIYGEKNDMGKLELHVAPGYFVTPTAELNKSLAYIMPEWQDERLDADEKPSEETDDGEYIARIYYSTAKAEIKIEEADDDPDVTEAKNVIPFATFTVEGGEIKDLEQLICGSVVHDGNAFPCFYPIIFDKNYGKVDEMGEPESKDMVLVITPGYVLKRDCPGEITKLDVESPDSVVLDTHPTPTSVLGSSGDTLYAKVETDPKDVITSSVITTEWGTDDPGSRRAVPPSDGDSGTDGIYYFPLFSIHGDDEAGWYVKLIQTTSIEWNPSVSIKNVGGGAKSFKKFNSEECEFEFRSHIANNSASGSTGGAIPVTMKVEEKDDEIEYSGSIDPDDLPDGGGDDDYVPEPEDGDGNPVTRATGDIILQDCNGAQIVKSEFKQGFFTGPGMIIRQGVSESSSSILFDNGQGCKVHLKNNIPAPNFLKIPAVAGMVLVNVCVNGSAGTMRVWGDPPLPLDGSGDPQISADDANDPGITDGVNPTPVSQP